MAISCRRYDPAPLFGPDYDKIRSFLIELDDSNYAFGRWDWMITHGYLQSEGLDRIGMWEDDGRIVGLVLYDTTLDGKCFLPRRGGSGRMLRDMVQYAQEHFAKDGRVRLMIRDGDGAMQDAASAQGFFATQDKECDAVLPIADGALDYALPDGFRITSMAETPDYYQYGRVLWKGFDHEANGEGPFSPTERDMEKYRQEFERPNVNPDIKIAVVAPDGNFASYCGMWHDPASQSALVEPVATDPAYRKLGLGRAAVLEAAKRCGRLGAKRAFVGSSQQFYYQIGFRPFATSTWWERKP